MSFIRRVKSFSVKKIYSSNDELKADVPRRVGPGGPRKKTLHRERSVSMDHVPLHIELEKSDLFHKQRMKREEEEEKQKRKDLERLKKRTRLTKRKSVSFDEVQFTKLRLDLEGEVMVRPERDGRGRREWNKARYNTIDVYKIVRVQNRDPDVDFQAPPRHLHHHQTNLVKSKSDWYINLIPDDDLIANCENNDKDGHGSVGKPATFPLPEEEVVQVRSNRNRPEVRPRTYATTLTKQKDDFLEIRGLSHLEIGKDLCVKFWPREVLRLQDGYLELIDDKNAPKQTLRSNVTLKKGAKILSKTELEIIDSDKTIYRLQFASNREAKTFLDLEKVYHAVPSSLSPFRNIGPWSQLRKLLKKRSSREILESKGIIKNEPIFGNTLEDLCDLEKNPVPEVVTRIVQLIETPENIKSVGLYRASANLAVVQNIRFEINCGRWEILGKHRTDVDVLAGTLKLFFRELKKPLISRDVYQELHKVIMSGARSEIKTVVDLLPHPNRCTLLYIIRHLLRVCQHKSDNKMDLHNIAICWGPSLITLPDNCTDLVAQTTEFTKITEEILSFYGTDVDDLDGALQRPAKPIDFVYEVVRKLTEIIERNVDVEGIYRKSGSNAKIDKIMKMLERGGNLEDLEKGDIHDLCCALKKYVASVRKTIMPDEFFHGYYEICDKIEDGEVHRMVSALPRQAVVRVLFEHLRRVVLNDRNKMSLAILSDIWMTTLLAGLNVQNYKKKMPRYAKLFEILMNLNYHGLPDLVPDRKMILSSYENVPEDIHDYAETGAEKAITKL